MEFCILAKRKTCGQDQQLIQYDNGSYAIRYVVRGVEVSIHTPTDEIDYHGAEEWVMLALRHLGAQEGN